MTRRLMLQIKKVTIKKQIGLALISTPVLPDSSVLIRGVPWIQGGSNVHIVFTVLEDKGPVSLKI